MNITRHLSQDDLALFALQLLEGDELRSAIDHLERCEECRHEVARFQGDLSLYALAGSTLHTPPAEARERLLKAVAREKKAVPQAPPRPLSYADRPSGAVPIAGYGERPSGTVPAAGYGDRPSGAVPVPDPLGNPFADENELYLAGRGRRAYAPAEPEVREPRAPLPMREPRSARTGGAASFLGWAGWAIAAGLAVVAGLQYRQHQNVVNDLNATVARLSQSDSQLSQAQSALETLTGAGAMQISLHIPVGQQPVPPQPEGHVAYSADRGALVFIADHLDPLQPQKTYELWLIPATGNPIPAGTFKPDARGVATVVMPDIPKGIAAKGFGVTVEPDGGSASPTPPIVLAGM